MKLAQADLVAALRLRYDHHSAQTMFDTARQRAGLADQPVYDAEAVAAFREALAAIGDRLGAVEARIVALLGDAPAQPAPAQPAPAQPAPAPAQPAPTQSAAAQPAPTAPSSAEVGSADVPAPSRAKGGKEPGTGKRDKRASTGARPAPAIETTVQLTGVDVREGEQVMMCGSTAALGDWDPARACPMARKGNRWLVTLELPPGPPVSFKFLRRAADGTIVWEGGDNRSLAAEPRHDATWR